MITEAEAKLEARLQAIEYLLSNLYAQIYLQMPDPVQEMQRGMEKLREIMRLTTIPAIDPALSDFATAELGEAVDRVLAMVREMIAADSRSQ